MGKKTNPYTVFVSEYAARHKINVSAAYQAAGDTWRAMSEQEKERYKEKAKAINGGRRGRPMDISVHRGNDSEQVAEQRESLVMRDVREKWIEEFISCSVDELKVKPIYIISFNVMCNNADNEYIPLEVGIVKYTFEDGIKESLHMFVDAGPAPDGFAREAREHSLETHQIPLDGFAPSTGYECVPYDKVLEKIDQFVVEEKLFAPSSGNIGVRPLFATPHDQQELALIQSRSCLATIGKRAQNVDFAKSFEVLDITKLLFNIYNKLGKGTFIGLCLDKMSSTTFDYTPNTRCDFHDEKDCKFCALSLSKKLAYLLSDNLCAELEITPTENHFPTGSSDEIAMEDYKFRSIPKKHKGNPVKKQENSYNESYDETPAKPSQSTSGAPTNSSQAASARKPDNGPAEPNQKRPGIGRGATVLNR
ncbi:protein maelstrom homolog [Brevipalpus obovatus]|uniref:protein maelstrom homolog n=1 Tax=Brevipalpus obovatus TaxID=246614 RepID=UPI003D9E0CD1